MKNLNEKKFDDYTFITPYIEGKSSTCSYCDHLSPLILLEEKHTYITIAIGQFVEGYLQICAQKHRTAATGLLPSETKELIKMKNLVRKAFKQIYKTPGIAFEHGKAGNCLWGNNRHKYESDLCHHFHIHYVPVNVDIRDLIKEYLPEEIIVSNLYELKKIREDLLEAEPYLYFEDVNEIGYVYPVEERIIPRQFLRNCVAQKLNIPEKADWATFPGTEFFQKTKENLMPILNQLALE